MAEIGQALAAARRCSARPCGRRWNASAGDAKKALHATERDPERVVALRRLFAEVMQEEDVARFVFVDETSTTRTHGRYDRAPAGRHLDQAVPLHGGPNGTLIAALTPDGLGALISVDGGRQRQRVCRRPRPDARYYPAGGRRSGARQFVGV